MSLIANNKRAHKSIEQLREDATKMLAWDKKGWDYKKMAKKLGRSPFSVYYQLTRLKMSLRDLKNRTPGLMIYGAMHLDHFTNLTEEQLNNEMKTIK